MLLMQLPTNSDILQIEAEFQTRLYHLFEYWITPILLQRWWAPQAECEPRQGGAYHLNWPQRNWHLRGHYTVFEPGRQLSFTWRWDHELSDSASKNVELLFESLADGKTRLLLTHGPYRATSEDQTRRVEEHLAGWMYFLARLQQVSAATV